MRNESLNLSKSEMIMVMRDQEREISELKAKIAELESKSANKDIKIENVGSLAEAAATVNGLFEAAQATADTYLANVKARAARSEEILSGVEVKANKIVAEAEAVAEKKTKACDAEIEKKTKACDAEIAEKREACDTEIAEKLMAAQAEVDEKWAVIESRLLVMYESHKGLKELVESGIFTIPGYEK